MTPEQKAVAALAQVAMALCLAGLIRTGRWRLSYGFTLYVGCILALSPLQTWLPGFNNWGYWQAKQLVYDAVKLLVALELAFRVCKGFPGATRSTQRLALLVLVLTAGGMITRPWNADWLLELSGGLHARAVLGTLWIFAATVVVVRHFRLPVNPFHFGLICGFSAYLAVWGVLLRMMQLQGWAAHRWWSLLDPPAYVLFALWLAWVAWRPNSQASDDYEAVLANLKERIA